MLVKEFCSLQGKSGHKLLCVKASRTPRSEPWWEPDLMMSCTHCPHCAWKAITSITFSAPSSSLRLALSCICNPANPTGPAWLFYCRKHQRKARDNSNRGCTLRTWAMPGAAFNPTKVSGAKDLIPIAAWRGTTLSSLPWLPLPLLSLAYTDCEILLQLCPCVTSNECPNTAVTQMMTISFLELGQIQWEVCLSVH